MSKYKTLEQKQYKTSHDRAGKVIQWESYKRLEFYQAEKQYMHKPEYSLIL